MADGEPSFNNLLGLFLGVKGRQMRSLRFYCTCGGALQASISKDSAAQEVERIWNSFHSGEGHSPCDARAASRARAREEAEFRKKYNND